MVFNATFVVVSFIGGGKRENHRQVTDKLYHIMLYECLVVIGTDCTIMITTMMVLTIEELHNILN